MDPDIGALGRKDYRHRQLIRIAIAQLGRSRPVPTLQNLKHPLRLLCRRQHLTKLPQTALPHRNLSPSPLRIYLSETFLNSMRPIKALQALLSWLNALGTWLATSSYARWVTRLWRSSPALPRMTAS